MHGEHQWPVGPRIVAAWKLHEHGNRRTGSTCSNAVFQHPANGSSRPTPDASTNDTPNRERAAPAHAATTLTGTTRHKNDGPTIVRQTNERAGFNENGPESLRPDRRRACQASARPGPV